jgi:RNA 2',3'-cyclic 3'-phosphodiesterase
VSGASTARLFVAVDPPIDVRERLVAWARAALADRAKDAHRARLRLIEAEMIHITICFLGERPLGDIESIGSVLHRCARPAGELSLGAPVWLARNHPRALAVEVHDDGLHLTHIQQSIRRALLDELGLQLKPGRFRAHVTVARMPAGEVPQRLRVLMATPAVRFSAQSLTLYRSRLSPGGASYEPLVRIVIDCPSGLPYPAAE